MDPTLPPQSSNVPQSNQPPQLTSEQTARIQEILSHPAGSSTPEKKSSTGWAIFWLIAFTPVGWYYVVKKTNWPTWVKILVIVLTLGAFVGLAIETELVAFQVTSALGSLGGADSNLPGISF